MPTPVKTLEAVIESAAEGKNPEEKSLQLHDLRSVLRERDKMHLLKINLTHPTKNKPIKN